MDCGDAWRIRRIFIRRKFKYKDILSLDLRKIRIHLADLEEVLQPFIGKLGKPDRIKIRKAVEKGEIPMDSFAGTFKKSPRDIVAIMRRPQG